MNGTFNIYIITIKKKMSWMIIMIFLPYVTLIILKGFCENTLLNYLVNIILASFRS